jgi:thiol-disulfide isomerase/thioredoxin
MASKRARAEAKRKKARRKKLLTWTATGLGVLAFSAVIVTAFSSGDAAVGSTGVENWDLPSLDSDDRVALSDFNGKPTVAAFFASWCEVCQRELPGFGALEDTIGEEVNFVGINTMNNGSGLAFAQRNGIGDWPLARDIGQHDGRQLATNFGARGSPTTVIYDEVGAVVDVTLGGMTAQQLAAKLQQFFGVTP